LNKNLLTVLFQGNYLKYQSKQKTVMIFHKRAKECMESDFYIDNEPNKIVSSYTYLRKIVSILIKCVLILQFALF